MLPPLLAADLLQLGGSPMAAEVGVGRATCAAWARRRAGRPARLLVVYGRAATASSPPRIDLHAFDAGASAVAADPLVSAPRPSSRTRALRRRCLLFAYVRSELESRRCVCARGFSQVSFVMGHEEDDAPRAIVVHPSGDEFVCATAKGCR